jgi:hypothetical protein
LSTIGEEAISIQLSAVSFGFEETGRANEEAISRQLSAVSLNAGKAGDGARSELIAES